MAPRDMFSSENSVSLSSSGLGGGGVKKLPTGGIGYPRALPTQQFAGEWRGERGPYRGVQSCPGGMLGPE